MEKILIHACCAHCLGKLLAGLKTEPVAYDPVLFWGNPNIHPLIEWRRRLKAVKMLAERAQLPLIADETYGLVEFCRAVHGHEAVPERCARCYALRLGRAATVAREAGCRVSMFIGHEPAQIEAAARIGAAVVELHTGAYCDFDTEGRLAERDAELAALQKAAAHAASLGLEVHAGHGLTFGTLPAGAPFDTLMARAMPVF